MHVTRGLHVLLTPHECSQCQAAASWMAMLNGHPFSMAQHGCVPLRPEMHPSGLIITHDCPCTISTVLHREERISPAKPRNQHTEFLGRSTTEAEDKCNNQCSASSTISTACLVESVDIAHIHGSSAGNTSTSRHHRRPIASVVSARLVIGPSCRSRFYLQVVVGTHATIMRVCELRL